nr:hypothetical protein [Tanacetum cinerariifolium]
VKENQEKDKIETKPDKNEKLKKIDILKLLTTNELWLGISNHDAVRGSVGFDNMLDPGCKDKLADDNDQEGLVKLVDKMSMEEHISANILDEKREASPRLSVTEV